MSKRVWVPAALAASLVLSAMGHAHTRLRDVTVELVDERGATFAQTPVHVQGKLYRAYLQAERGAHYRIRIVNRSGERVGVVVAVDGRNIISGSRSELEKGEPMYILGPWDTQEYSGWRTSLADVHEFYFTDWQDSYAEAFGDRSARGVIAVAVYREKEQKQRLYGDSGTRGDDASGGESRRDRDGEARASEVPVPPAAQLPGNAASSDSSTGRGDSADHGAARDKSSVLADRAAKAESPEAEPGTGYGDRRDEPAVRVAFDPEARASSRVFLKYEWRETLCRKGIIDCREPENRFWPDTLSFAPPPPNRFE